MLPGSCADVVRLVPRCQAGPRPWGPPGCAGRASGLDAGTVPGAADVVGHSFGGQVAIDLALLAPQRIKTLTLVCSRDTPFSAFAAAVARLRHGDPVDTAAALGRWFTEPELDTGGPVRCAR